MGEKRALYSAVLLALLVILCLNFAAASFQVGEPNSSIAVEYEKGEEVTGWVNISFSNESEGSLFTDSFGNSITLLELLNENSQFVYNITGGIQAKLKINVVLPGMLQPPLKIQQ